MSDSTRYNATQQWDSTPIVLNDQSVAECAACGALILTRKAHDEWHARVDPELTFAEILDSTWAKLREDRA